MLKRHNKIRIFIFAVLLFFTSGLLAQHCPFDGSGIIVLKIHSSGSADIIAGLKVTLIDSLGKPAGEFWQNPEKTTYHGPIDCNHRADVTRMRFPFAKDNYVFVGFFNLLSKPHTIRIEYTDGNFNDGHFSAVVVKPASEDMYSLCGTYKMDEYPSEYHGILIDYKPVEICLTAE